MTITDFQNLVAAVESTPGYLRPAAFAIGLANLSPAVHGQSRILDTWFPVVNKGENYGSAAVLAQVTGHLAGSASYHLSADQLEQALAAFAPFLGDGKWHGNIEAIRMLRSALHRGRTVAGETQPQAVVVTFIGDLAVKPVDAHDAYLRLHLLSHRLVKPHGQNLEGIFGLLSNVVWSDHGPFDPETFERTRLKAAAEGVKIQVHSVDKFPRMVDYVLPTGVRIADADRVRLGAHLAEGTTVMHEGFCNFNAGTLGKSMVEGRISSGVVVGVGSDIGGGASIMGTLSGGGKQVISIGENSLLGANAGLGISLGNGCSVEAGLYITAGSKVRLPDGTVIKASDLSGQDDLLFRRNSQTGALEVIPKKNQVILNAALHAN